MRLKIFFAPVAFLVAGIIAIWYIWPSFQQIVSRTKELKSSKEAYELAVKRKENVEILRGVLDKNKETENFVKSYLPPVKSDERIVDGLNYLAADSGISLVNVSIEEEKDISPKITDGNNLTQSNPTIINNKSASSGDASFAKNRSQVKFFTAKISVSGKYENIKMFLGQVHRMEILNKIKSISISKIQTNSSGSSEDEKTDSSILTGNFEIKFAYMPLINEDGGSGAEVFSNNNIDFSPYEKLENMIAKKIPQIEEGQRGKSNPFLP